MTLLEKLKTKFLNQKEPNSYSDKKDNYVNIEKSNKYNYDGINPNIGFIDYDDDTSSFLFSKINKNVGTLQQQVDYINEYRKLANSPEGRLAIDEIVNEAIFNVDDNDIIKIKIKEGNLTEKTCETLINEFNEIQYIFDLNSNISYLFEKWYVDGQLIIQLVYDNNDLSAGIVGFNVLNPKYFYYNKKRKVWTYAKQHINKFTNKKEIQTVKNDREYTNEEIIFLSSDIYEDAKADIYNDGLKIIKSHLHNAIKTFNQLTTLEDMLIPMRFSRSVSRRIFNVDVGDLPPSKAEAALNRIKDKFKYKKYYDVEKGTISNQMHISSLVEDYWFQNRNGSKGTQVDTLDESGNLGEITDILYFRKKLYTALKIPASRISNEFDSQEASFDFTGTEVSREEIKFYMFIKKLRNQFSKLFMEILKRQLIVKGILKDEFEWNNIKKYIKISFYKENVFLEKMETDALSERISLYGDIEDLIGQEFSRNWVRKNVLKLSDEDILNMKKEIEEESENKNDDENDDDY